MFARHVRAVVTALVATAAVLGGCGPARQEPSVPLTPRGLISTNLVGTNGIAVNGIAVNGIAVNGVTTNGMGGFDTNGLAFGDGSSGIASNGLTQGALLAPEFTAWFALDPAYSSMVMTYVVRCALADGQSLTYAYGGASYVWSGTYGVAPIWPTGVPIPPDEQQLVSACMAAHVNALGQHVEISMRGYLANGSQVATTAEELASWTNKEACYFGNLFDRSGVWNALESDLVAPAISTPRGCAAEFGQAADCSPMGRAGNCADVCVKGADGQYWGDCVLNGVHFKPVQTFLRSQDVYACGDGTCQSITENELNCPADCAPRPTTTTTTTTTADPTATPTDPTATTTTTTTPTDPTATTTPTTTTTTTPTTTTTTPTTTPTTTTAPTDPTATTTPTTTTTTTAPVTDPTAIP